MPFVNGRWAEGHGQSLGREGPAPFAATGGARPDLDLTEYVNALGGDAARYISAGFVQPRRPAPAVDTSVLDVRKGSDYDPSRPLLYGSGPVEASTSQAVQATPTAIWDVNGYYRILGFSWPFTPTRRELTLAYQAKGIEPLAHEAYAFKQLRDPAVRAAYDRSPLGEPFYDDRVSAGLKRAAKLEAWSRSARLDREITPEEVLDDWGLKLDEGPPDTGGKPSPARPTVKAAGQAPWPWSFYLWRSHAHDRGKLAIWQELLVEQFAILGIHTKFSVGYCGNQPHPWVSVKVGNRTALLLNEEEEPTTEMARQAVGFVRQGLLDQSLGHPSL